MNNAAVNLGARISVRISEAIKEIRQEFQDDPAYRLCGGDPILIALILTLCNSVMMDENWDYRRQLFDQFAGMEWHQGVEVRERLDELLNGINLRADYWHSN